MVEKRLVKTPLAPVRGKGIGLSGEELRNCGRRRTSKKQFRVSGRLGTLKLGSEEEELIN